MKKFLIGLVIISLGFAGFAAERFDAKTTNKDVVLTHVNAKDKFFPQSSLILAMIEKNKKMDTYDNIKSYYIELNKKIDYKFYSVLTRNPLFEKFRHAAWLELKTTTEQQYNGIKLVILRNPKSLGLEISKDECWYEIGKIMTENRITNKKQVQAAIKYLIENDIKIPKDDKIKLYTGIYEQYLHLIVDEQNLQINEKYITKSLSQIALKLKALGVTIK
jgi:hypothetical protein